MKSKKHLRKYYSYRTRRDRHSVSVLTDHLVFCTKYRKPLLRPEIAIRCEEIIRAIAKDLDIRIYEIAVNDEHVHIFFVYPPKLSVSHIAERFKGISSRILRKEFPELKREEIEFVAEKVREFVGTSRLSQ